MASVELTQPTHSIPLSVTNSVSSSTIEDSLSTIRILFNWFILSLSSLSCEGMRCNPVTVTLTVAGASQQTYAVRPVRITTTEGLKQNLASTTKNQIIPLVS